MGVLCLAMFPRFALAVTVTNTGSVTYDLGAVPLSLNSTVSLNTIPLPTPTVVEFFQFAPGVPTSTPTPVDGGMCQTAPSVFAPLPPPTDFFGGAINAAAAPLVQANQYHAGEPTFIVLSDANRNIDPAAREMVNVQITTDTGDQETLQLQETGPNTGVFAASVQSAVIPPAAIPFDCRVSVGPGNTVTVDYTDPFYPTDTAQANILVDPFGIVFDSSTGAPIDGAVVTLIDANTGNPANVLGDDGISTFPSTITTGGGATDSSGQVYTFSPGGFRFPFILPGDYRFRVVTPNGYTVPSAVPLPVLQTVLDPNGNPYAVGQGSFGDTFTIVAGPAVRIDVAADPLQYTLRIDKTVSTTEVSVGDFLRYQLTMTNLNTVDDATNAVITDTLPLGMRFQDGSLRMNGLPAPDPAVSGDGRTLTIPIGTLPASGAVEITYVVQVGASARAGQAVNRATAAADLSVASNAAQAVVRIREALFGEHVTIIGRVLEGDCDSPQENLKGVPNVRILMDDGTYVLTDQDGQYHFNGVRPGTHVVQMDLDSLPSGVEVNSCIQNSRFAGRSYSQFVEAQGGSLWKADFFVTAKPPQEGTIRLRLQSSLNPEWREPPPVPRQYKLFKLFDSLSARLTPEKEMDLDAVATKQQGVDIQHIEVVGYTDDVPISSRHQHEFADNFALSLARAQAVGDYLAEKLHLSADQVRAIGHGPDDAADNGTEDGRQLNRRVEVTIYAREASGVPPSYAGARFQYRVDMDGGAVPAKNVRVSVMLPDGVAYEPGTSTVDGAPAADPTVTDNLLTYNLGDTGANWRHTIGFSGRTGALPQVANGCPPGGYTTRALIALDTDQNKNVRTSAVNNVIACPSANLAASGRTAGLATQGAQNLAAATDSGAEKPAAFQADSGTHATTVLGRPQGADGPVSVSEDKLRKRRAIPDDVRAAGGDMDWLAGQKPGIEWLFPQSDHNPRAPAVRVVIKHAPNQAVVLTSNGEPVSPLSFDGVQASAEAGVAVSVWRGLPLVEGDNVFEADVRGVDGRSVATLSRVVHYANQPARVELVPEESVLVANGIDKPVIAVRLLDRHNRPVRAGVTGAFAVNPPYVPAQTVQEQQERQLAGLDRFLPPFTVEGDDGVAYIELSPTTEAGAVMLTFTLQNGQSSRTQELRTWLEAAPRDWVVVGFAAGTIGYETLKGNMQALEDQGREEGVYTDGQVSLYAKGRVSGEWLLTLAYDSDKPDNSESLFSVIDPNEFYTLYGDSAEQRYDASSREKLYLKLERRQFYALFGDYDTGLTQSQLSRYNRSLTGVKTEYHDGSVDVTAYASETDLNFARDEIQGDGTSGLYRLSNGFIVINSEKIRIETRDRLKSERILQTRMLLRHLDYDIDYSAGTVFFREPINSRDQDFNPIFIVAEYETTRPADTVLNAGGRVGSQFLGGKLMAGLSYIRDEADSSKSDLGGLDATLKLGLDTELRLEGALSEGRTALVDRDGGAYLIELEHHAGRFDALTYARRQDPEFGVNQQNASESGMAKFGLDAQARLTDRVALRGEFSMLDNLSSDATRDMAKAQLEYRSNAGGARGGVQFATDQAASGEEFRSQQAMLGANRYFFEKKLELQAQTDLSLGGNNDSVDFPTRYQIGANYALTDDVRLLLVQEITNGAAFDSSMTRFGLQAVPWRGARLTSTLNQSHLSEYGPRTFGQLGLTQTFLVGEHWAFDLSGDSNQTFNESGTPPLVINPNHPITSGGMLNDGLLTENFFALSGGATYRTDLWSWNGRLESRNGERTDRYGIRTGFLRQAQAGIGFALSAEAFRTDQELGTQGTMANLSLSWAFRPLGQRWSLLDRLEYRTEEIQNGSGVAGSGLFGNTSLTVAGDARSRRLINNFVVNRVSDAWSEMDRQGNLFQLHQRNQWSLFYGAKYVLDRFDGVDYSGYTDLLGLEWRYDITRVVDVGLKAGMLHVWTAENYAYSWGPMIGYSPIENVWISLGYNVLGFNDRDFSAANYTAQGFYVQLRIKFDQFTRLPSAKRGEP
jgi:uncharacterized repeat protein (TIGR01451 family)